MKAIKVKPILFKEGDFVYPLSEGSQLTLSKFSELKKKAEKKKEPRQNSK